MRCILSSHFESFGKTFNKVRIIFSASFAVVVGEENPFGNYSSILNPHPCPICHRMLKNSGIKKVVTMNEEEIYGID